MKKKKMILGAGLIFIMVISMVSCGNSEGTDSEYEDAAALLTAVYETYSEEDRLPVCGGNGETANEEGPGAFNLENAEEFETVTGFPSEYVENVSDAATMMHLMNANNLTVAAFKYEGDTETLADVYTEAVDDKNWLCGAPEKFVIMKAGGYIISAFGQNDILDTFTGYTEKLIDNAEVLTEHSVTE